MFLSRLDEKEKKAFLSLAYEIRISDGNIAPEENDMIHDYCIEMHFDNFDEFLSHDEMLDILSKSSIQNKKIVIFESIGLAYADGKYSPQEKRIIESLAMSIGISQDEVGKMEESVLKYIVLCCEIKDLILTF